MRNFIYINHDPSGELLFGVSIVAGGAEKPMTAAQKQIPFVFTVFELGFGIEVTVLIADLQGNGQTGQGGHQFFRIAEKDIQLIKSISAGSPAMGTIMVHFNIGVAQADKNSVIQQSAQQYFRLETFRNGGYGVFVSSLIVHIFVLGRYTDTVDFTEKWP